MLVGFVIICEKNYETTKRSRSMSMFRSHRRDRAVLTELAALQF